MFHQVELSNEDLGSDLATVRSASKSHTFLESVMNTQRNKMTALGRRLIRIYLFDFIYSFDFIYIIKFQANFSSLTNKRCHNKIAVFTI